jgi:hypothetical protein
MESPEEAMALLERVKTHTSSPEDRERLTQLIRVTLDVSDHIWAKPAGQPPPDSKRPSAKSTSKRQRQWTKAARRRQRA